MSDAQILTGFSILISGYAQLRCGLSCYHWQLLVYLAWFSSVTHLACLTFLRHYLYIHPGERAWRLVLMFLLAVMLLVAIVPTGNYNWGNGPSFDESTGQLVYPTPSPTDYAICHIGRAKTTDKLTFASMVISVLLIAFGFLSRVVRLHKTLSVRVVGGTRRYVSEKVFEWLQKVYDWCHPGTTPSGIRRLLLYRPLLALFLSVRVISDAWTSMFVEVS